MGRPRASRRCGRAAARGLPRARDGLRGLRALRAERRGERQDEVRTPREIFEQGWTICHWTVSSTLTARDVSNFVKRFLYIALLGSVLSALACAATWVRPRPARYLGPKTSEGVRPSIAFTTGGDGKPTWWVPALPEAIAQAADLVNHVYQAACALHGTPVSQAPLG